MGRSSGDLKANRIQIEEKENNGEETVDTEIEVPDGGYGWVVLLAVFLYNFCTWGANAGYAVYLAHYLEQNTFPGGNKLDFAAIGGLSYGAGLLFSPLITVLSHKTSVHFTIAIGIVFQGAGLLLAAFSKKLWQIYLTQGLLISLGLAFILIPSISLLPQWFRTKRSLAMGIATGGSGLGGIMYNLAMQRIIEKKSVKWALIVQFILGTTLSFIALLLTRTRREIVLKNSKVEVQLLDKQLLINLCPWLIYGWVSMTVLGYIILLYSLSAFTTSLGYSSEQGSYVSCMVSVGNVVGRPIIGHIADRYGPISIGVLVHLLVAIFAWAMWIPCRNLATAITFALIEGALMGTLWPILGSVLARAVGLRKLDAAFSTMWLFLAISSIPAPVIGLQLRSNDPSDPNTYINTALLAGFGYFCAAIFLWLLRGYIIARDNSISDSKAVDKDELHIKVSPLALLGGLMTVKSTSQRVV